MLSLDKSYRQVFANMLRVLILITTFIAVKGNNCVPKSFGHDRIVCVCNSSYCDSPEMRPLNENQFAWYVSTKDGKRLQLSVNNFAKQPNGTSFTVDKNKMYQTIFGFGGAMTDAAALNIRTLSNNTQYNLLEAYFGEKGIGYTFCRIPLGGTDFSTRPYTYDDTPDNVPDDTLSNFSLMEEDNYKIDFLHYIQDLMPESSLLRIFTTAWSAPAWMKYPKIITYGYLLRKYYQLYAEYWKKFFDEYKERGIDIWGLTPGNEPFDGFIRNFSFNAMAWTPQNESEWIVNYLQPTLSKAGYNPVYMMMDDQRFELPWFVDEVLSVPGAKQIFSGTAYHWYTDKYFSSERLTKTHNKYPDKFLLMTEACKGSESFIKVIIGSWERGVDYMTDMITSLTHWVVGWIDWNIALNETGGPNWAENYVDSPIIVNAEDDEFYKQPMFYALAHISKFVPRGSHRISAEGIENKLDIKAMAFLTPEDKIVVVVLNKGNEFFDITIKDKSKNNMNLNIRLPPNSFNTILYLSQ